MNLILILNQIQRTSRGLDPGKLLPPLSFLSNRIIELLITDHITSLTALLKSMFINQLKVNNKVILIVKQTNNSRKAQYNNAYGNYRGGYRGSAAFRRGPPPLMDLPGPPFGFFGPRGPYGPPGPQLRAGPMHMYGRNFHGAPMDEKTIRFLMSEYIYLYKRGILLSLGGNNQYPGILLRLNFSLHRSKNPSNIIATMNIEHVLFLLYFSKNHLPLQTKPKVLCATYNTNIGIVIGMLIEYN